MPNPLIAIAGLAIICFFGTVWLGQTFPKNPWLARLFIPAVNGMAFVWLVAEGVVTL